MPKSEIYTHCTTYASKQRNTRDCVTQLILSTLANIAHIKRSRLRESVPLHSLLQFSRRLQYVFFS